MKRLHSALLIALMASGCMAGSKGSSRENEALIEKARTKVFASGVNLSSSEHEAVKHQQPKIRIYRLAGDYADYHFEWVANATRIVVFGKGKLDELQGSEVQKIEKRAEPKGSTLDKPGSGAIQRMSNPKGTGRVLLVLIEAMTGERWGDGWRGDCESNTPMRFTMGLTEEGEADGVGFWDPVT